MANASTYHLHDRLLGGRLGPMLLEWREPRSEDDKRPKFSAEEIAYKLRSEFEIKASAATVLRWIDLAETEAQAAAS